MLCSEAAQLSDREATEATTWLTSPGSCKDPNTIEPQISRWTEATLATVW